jgi:hypothetical protein
MKYKKGDKVQIIARSCRTSHPCCDHPNGVDGCIGDIGIIQYIYQSDIKCLEVDFNGSLNGARHFCSFKESEVSLATIKELI